MLSDEETPHASGQPTLRFLGAADTVTGSRYLIETGSTRVLVDCGLFQGLKVLRERNRAPFPVPPASIDAVVITHAHLDHSGYIPALVRDGFRGRVYATEATTELAGVMLPDSGYLLEEEARHAASHRWSAHANPVPLYTAADAERALPRFHPVPFHHAVEVAPGVEIGFTPAGHILGAAGVHASAGGTSVHFTGDLGRYSDPVMRPPARARALRRARRRIDVRRPRALAGGCRLRARGRDRAHDPQGRGRAHPGVRGRPHGVGPAAARTTATGGPAARGADLPQQPDGDRGGRHLRTPPGGAPAERRGDRPDVQHRHAGALRGRVEAAQSPRRADDHHLGERDADRRQDPASPRRVRIRIRATPSS